MSAQVFVDSLRDWGWRYGSSCHLHTLPGWENELHTFAAALGLKRSWYQSGVGGKMPHYDLTARNRALAVKLGAVEVNDNTLSEHLRLWRNTAKRAREIILEQQVQIEASK